MSIVPLVVLAASRAQAQDGDPGANARFHVGVVSFTPTFTVANFGFDSNVFNDSTDPKSDITATLQPAIDTSMRIGRTRLSWSGRSDATLFKRYTDQSTVGTFNTIRLDVPLNRLRFSIGDSYVNARERPTLDIDTRVRRHENAVNVAADLRLNALTHVGMTADLGAISFDRGVIVNGAPLGYVLDRENSRLGVTLQRSLTPLTSVVGSVDIQHEKFSGDSTRNNVSRRAAIGLSFKPLALVSGRFDVGVLNFEPESGRLPAATAPAVSADLGYTLLGTTRIGVRMDRVVSYSIDETAAYSLQTGLSTTVRHNIRESFDITGSIVRQVLAYQVTPAGGANSIDPAAFVRTTVSSYDAALGYRARSIRWGMHVTYMVREPSGEAVVATRFENFRTFVSASYGSKF